MLFGLIGKSILRRRHRKLLALAAVALGITVTTAVATIALDVGDKVTRELRSFGANISVIPAADTLPVVIGGVDYRPAGAGAFLDEHELPKLKQIFWGNNILAFAPFLEATATIDGRRVAIAGTWFERAVPVNGSLAFRTGLVSLHPAWRVEGQWPKDDAGECLVGQRLAASLGLKLGDEIQVATAPSSNGAAAGPVPTGASAEGCFSMFIVRPPGSASGVERSSTAFTPKCRRDGGATAFKVRGLLQSGGPADEQIFAPLRTVQNLVGLDGKVRRVEVSALTKPDDNFARSDPSKMSPEQMERWSCSPYVRSIAYQIQQALPDAEARPVYQVAETEGRILDRIGALMWILVAAGLLTAGLAVASIMLANVLERRPEIGVFKSLGATDARVAAVFLLEATVVGATGGAIGYFAGSLLGRVLARSAFGSPAGLHWVILPAVEAIALAVALIGSAIPLAQALKLSTAAVMRE